MDSFKEKLSRLYLDKIIKKDTNMEKIKNFIDKNLCESDKYMSLQEYISLAEGAGYNIVCHNNNYMTMNKLELNDHVLPVQFNDGSYFVEWVQTIDMKELEFITYKNEELISIKFSFVIGDSKEVFLLKCYIFKEVIIYRTFNLKMFHIGLFGESYFFIQVFPEFMNLINNSKHRIDIYEKRDFLFKNAIEHMHKDDVYYIKQGLGSENFGMDSVKVTFPAKKKITLKGDKGEVTMRFSTSTIRPIDSKISIKGNYRINLRVSSKDDAKFILVKAIDSESRNKGIYILVRDEKKKIKELNLKYINIYVKKRSGKYFIDETNENSELRLNFAILNEF